MDTSIVLINAKIYEENQIIPDGFIKIKGMEIKETGWMSKYKADDQSNVIDLQGQVVIPGMIDIHIHGTAGADVMDGEIASLETMVKALPQEGTTAFLATTMTQSDENISKALKNTANFIKNYQKPGQSEILGVHLEGPFVNPSMAGAQPVEYIISPEIPLFEKWQKLAERSIKLVTMAPEQKGGLELIRYLKQNGVVISIGHSDAKFTDVKKGIEAGVTQVTHLFNQMKGLHHREPGVVGAALLLEELYAELIVDGIHVCPEMIQLAYRNKNSEKLILITDSMRAKCLKNGEYDLGGQLVSVKDGMAVLENGALAGSVLKLNDAMKNMLNYCDGCNLADVIKMTSTNPAKQLNISDRKGSIRVGKDADLVVLNSEYDVLMTFCRGVLSYQKKGAF
ncbi:N-acetylglucosamine-6-phosphate deacetylase [Lysinibacillus contaminans]|uniref:N-acetylglucosamine-6-phosphate deacetylase n=1 Tax=Lysinibacillus contaminans TaxID=1293441 RepID=A0ABR5K361_9BACI|nr:N-acetylglucosamine-6-phosphate deacetylase [Lysinibacillus contaminans]KOS69105.1 N-acetylglucosamine-6-phosphate deacetylase [Lysinibacillus contaminans]